MYTFLASSWESLLADQTLGRALKKFKIPTSATEMRSFPGAVNQMSSWWPQPGQHCVWLRKKIHADADIGTYSLLTEYKK